MTSLILANLASQVCSNSVLTTEQHFMEVLDIFANDFTFTSIFSYPHCYTCEVHHNGLPMLRMDTFPCGKIQYTYITYSLN